MLPKIRMNGMVIGVVATGLLGGCAADAIRSGQVTKNYHRAKSDTNVARRQSPTREAAVRPTHTEIETGSIDKNAGPVTSKADPRWQWCEQRHIDHQAGKAPGGATDLAKKLEDDRTCATVYGYSEPQGDLSP